MRISTKRTIGPAQVELTAPWVDKFHDAAERVWETREGELAREFLSAGYPTYHVSPRTLELTEAWLAVPGRPEPARRLMAEGRDMIQRALRARATDAAAGGAAAGDPAVL